MVAAILLATALAVVAAVGGARDERRSTRQAVAEPAVRALAAEVARSAASLEDLRAFFEASGQVDERGFRRFVTAPLARQPSLGYLAWEPRGGGPGYLVRGPGARGPLAPPRADAALEVVRDAARDAATPAMTAPVAATADERLALVVAPVYAEGAAIETVAERRGALRGFVSGAIRLDSLDAFTQSRLPRGVRITVRDDGAPVLGGDGGELGADGGELAGTIDVAGRRWIAFLSGLDGPSPALPIAIAIAGLLLSGVVTLLFVESAGREQSVRDELARLRVREELILSSAGDGIIGVDETGRAGFVNPAAARMLGWDADDLTGRAIDASMLPPLTSALRDGKSHSGEEMLRRQDGTTFPGEFTASPIVTEGATTGAVVTFRDVTSRKRLEAQTLESLAAAEELAAIDPLTALANHRTFHDRLRSEVERARRNRRGLSLVLMDLDHFKRVNDLHGHQTGDRVLEHAARVFEGETRTGELVARVGGEEFAMILPEADMSEAFRAAERIRKAVASSVFPAIGEMTVSAGVCDLPQGQDADGLYRLADRALYWAKHRGRDMVVRYTPDAIDAPSTRDAVHELERQQALLSVRMLARVIDAKDPSTRRHSERVGELSADIAQVLGWSPERAALLREAGLIHDVGKIGLPEGLLSRPSGLSPQEYELVKEHATLGSRIVSELLTAEQVSWVRGHHERWDGNGYPDALTAEECPEGARIIALADAWDVMTSERPYATVPSSPADALRECKAHAGTQFWPDAVDALIRLREGQ